MAKAGDLTVNVRTMIGELAELIPARARTAVYAAAIAVALLALAVQWVAAIWWPELDDRVDRTTAGVVAVALLVVSVLATAYRPTRGELPTAEAVPILSDAVDLAHIQATRAQTIQTLVRTGWSHEAAVAAVDADDFTKLGASVRPQD